MKKIIRMLLIILLLFTMIPCTAFAEETSSDESIIASGSCGTDASWILNKDGVLEITGTGIIGANSLAGFTYTEDQPWYDYAEQITSVTISEGITVIGFHSFTDLVNVKNVYLPSTVTKIGSNAFTNCTALECIDLPQGLIEIGGGAFLNCDSLYQVTIPDTVTRIGSGAFAKCNNLVRMYIPKSVESIEGSVFSSSNALINIHYEGSQEEWDAVSNYTAEDYGINRFIFNSNGSTATWHYENGVLTIFGEGRMDTYDSTSCYKAPWYHLNTEIKKIVIEEGITSIGNYAFYNQDELKEVIIADSVTEIGNYAFENCEKLSEIDIPASVIVLGTNVFGNCTSLTSIVLPENLVSIGYGAFQGCSGIENIDIPETVTTIESLAFMDCKALKSISLPSGLTKISDWTFSGCSSLKTIEIPESVNSIGALAFQGCTNLDKVTLPTNLEVIDEYAFNGCINLTEIVILDGVTSIGERAFYGCTALKELIIPESVAEIEDSAFLGCENLTNIVFKGMPTIIGDTIFSNDNIVYRSYYALSGSDIFNCLVNNYKNDYTKIFCLNEHDFSDEWTIDKEATCTEAGSKSIHCSKCDANKDTTVIVKLDHEYGDWTIDEEPTCTEAGSKHKECSCGDVVTEEIPVIDHNWNSNYTVDQEPTCTEEGSKSIHCSKCDANKDTTVIAKLDHEYGDWTIDKEPTCTEAGSKHKECSCGDVVTEEISVIDHSWNSNYTVDKEATCTEAGSKSIHCSNCSEVKNATTIEKKAHDFSIWLVDEQPTCTEDGFIDWACSMCLDEYYTEILPASGHNWDEYYTVDQESTCTEDGSKSIHCSNCDATKEVLAIPPIGHSYSDNWSMSDTVHWHSCACGSVIDAGYHTYEWIENNGLMDQICSTCGYVKNKGCLYEDIIVGTTEEITLYFYVNSTVTVESENSNIAIGTISGTSTIVSSSGVLYGKTIKITPSRVGITKLTIKSNGYVAREYCIEVKPEESTVVSHVGNNSIFTFESLHDEDILYNNTDNIKAYLLSKTQKTTTTSINGVSSTFTKYIYKIRITYEKAGDFLYSLFGSETGEFNRVSVNVTEHNWNEYYTIDKEASCTEEGSKSIHCSVCDATKDTVTIEKKAHEYGDWILDKASTCTEVGSKHKSCSCGDIVTEEVAALGHSWSSNYTVDKEPTCTAEGSKSIHCSNCNETKNATTIEKKAHNYGDWVIDKEPTCTEVGSKHKSCSCGDIVTEEVAALGHSWSSNYTVDKEPTCTAEGSKSIHCSVCDATKDTVTIEKKAHEYGDWILDKTPTCTEVGSKHKSCSCGDIVTEEVAALGHSWNSNYTVDQEPTCTTEGSKSIHCSNCNETKDPTTIEKKAHNYGDWILDKASTCTEVGSKHKSCSCGDVVTEKIAATGHSYKTVVTKATTSSNGLSKKVCKTCEYVKSKTTIYKVSSVKLSTTSYTYDNSKKTPTVTVKDSKGNKLTKGEDYTVTYGSSKRTAVGRYSVKVTFKGDYSGSKTLYFTIGPKNPSTVTAALYGHDDIKVSWSKVSGATGYVVYYKKSTASTWSSKSTTGTSVKLADFTDGAKYSIKVVTYKKVNGYKCYNAGKTTSIYTLKTVPGVKVAKSSTNVKVSWTNISGETGYQISQSTKKDGTNIVATYKTTSGNYKKLSATKGKTYYYKVRAYKVVDGKKICGPWSTAVKYVRK